MTMATKYTSPAEDAATIRAALKKIYKITSRQVSVKTHVYSMGSSLYINIHDHKIDIKEVKNIADGKEKIDYDEASGEILSGGNRFVDVKYSDKAAESFLAENQEMIARIMMNQPEKGTHSWSKDESGYGLSYSFSGHMVLNGENGKMHHVSENQERQALSIAAAILGIR
jgi:hypothetical protein